MLEGMLHRLRQIHSVKRGKITLNEGLILSKK